MLINDEIQRQVLPTIVKATSISSTGDLEQRSASQLQLNPGQQVKAEIIATLPNHLYLARIAGEMFKIELPVLVEPGQSMNLTFVTADPRVTFEFAPSGRAATSIQVSSLGKWISSTLQDAPSLPPPEILLDAPPEEGGALLAPRLREALVQSGLFYESHLARWAAGQFQLQELLREPQGRLSPASGKDERMKREAKPEEEVAAFADRSTLPLVKEQLSLLGSGFLSWKGEAWPGQEVELAVTRDREEGEERQVQANLSVDLPNLGRVDAKLRFGPEGLALELSCEEPDASEALREGAEDLMTALALSGIRLRRMGVRDAQRGE